MTNEEVLQLMACFDKSTATTMKLTMHEFSLELTKGVKGIQGVAENNTAAPLSEVCRGKEAADEADAIVNTIDAPMVGTFYAAPSPESAPFVKAGDKVYKGQTVCLMEAMKMMSEVHAPCDCIITEVIKGNGELAEFGEALFGYEPC